MKTALFIILTLFTGFSSFAQKDTLIVVKDSINWKEVAYKPTKAAFYSAILPGLGQAYNKKYWKIPLVYGALATTGYFFIRNKNKYTEFRSLYKQKKIDESSVPYAFDYLQRAQEFHRKKRDGNLLLTAAVYILQIVEASVDAHLQYHNVNPTLSYKPAIIYDKSTGSTHMVAGIRFTF